DNTGLVYLRARYYDPTIARFMTKDTWGGDMNQPMTLNNWLYVQSNPINFIDTSGKYPIWCQFAPNGIVYEACVLSYYQLEPLHIFSIGSNIKGSRGCYKGKIEYRAPGYLEGVGGFIPPLLGELVFTRKNGHD
ncbi:MAG: RHS repeat-associated core domain-containing protein, partial [Anaerolineales bacterium]